MNYEWHRPLGKFSVPWQSRGDEWISRLVAHLKEISSISGHGRRAGGEMGPFVEVRVSTEHGEFDTRLLIFPLPEDAIEVWACGNEAVNLKLVDNFREAAEKATAGLEEKDQAHKWSAIIGDSTSMYSEAIPRRLSQGFKLPGVELLSAERYFWNVERAPVHTMSSWSFRPTVPITVRGSSLGYDWGGAQPLAAEQLGKLAAFLSLVWGVLIDVMEPPTPLEWGERRLPDHPPWIRLDPDMKTAPAMDELPAFEVADWLADAWVRLNKRTKLQTAVSMYMEGLRIEGRHPSLALVSYVSTVEAISLMLFHEQRCGVCRNHVNIGDKFFETLRLAVGQEGAESLRRVYGSRSKTVHTGRLHGAEVAPGAFRFSSFVMPPEASFQWQILRGMKTAAQKLLMMAIKGQLPGRSHFVKSGEVSD
ncbi:hypothetical protein JTP67_05755 [Streptomyces sp. S12]|nr:hypothetical protein [Streptomyces sp. S12]